MGRIFLVVALSVFLLIAGCLVPGPSVRPTTCSSDANCSSYCGNDPCLQPACRMGQFQNSTGTYCTCLGLCGVK